MSLQSFATRFAVTLLVGMVPVLAGAQARTDGTETWTPSRDADGRPDLQGVWGFRTITPLQRPAPLGDREVLTDEEAAAFEAQAAQASVPQLNGFTYNAFWWDFGTNVAEGNRTSLIVDPPDGRLPDPIANIPTQFGSVTGDVPSTHPVRYRSGGIGADGPEDRGLAERCILGFNSGPPMVPSRLLKNTRIGLFSWPSCVSRPPPRQRCARGHAVPTRGPATPAAGDQGHLASRFRNRTKL